MIWCLGISQLKQVIYCFQFKFSFLCYTWFAHIHSYEYLWLKLYMRWLTIWLVFQRIVLNFWKFYYSLNVGCPSVLSQNACKQANMYVPISALKKWDILDRTFFKKSGIVPLKNVQKNSICQWRNFFFGYNKTSSHPIWGSFINDVHQKI
jgi:hypothetical protein